MRKEPILSVIVPIYNVEQYLAECLDSLISQTEKNIEILCIDDGSTDKSKSIVETYISRYNNIKLICQPNRGLSAARNTGIYNAKGTYIAFIDPDDTVSENMYQKMLTVANTYQLDLVMCGFKTIPDNNIIYPNFPANRVCSTLDFIKYNKKIHEKNDLCFSWRFLLRKEWVFNKQIFFNEKIRYAEDMPYNLKALVSTTKVYLIKEALYYYRVNNTNSIMRSKYNPYMEDSLTLQVKDKKELIEKYNLDQYTPITYDMAQYIIKRYTDLLFRNAFNNPNPSNKLKSIAHILSLKFIRESFRIVGYKNLYNSKNEYIFYLLMKWKISFAVYNILKRQSIK